MKPKHLSNGAFKRLLRVRNLLLNQRRGKMSITGNATGYELSKHWFEFCSQNPEKITPTDTALYFYIVNHFNQLGWRDIVGLPTDTAMETLGISNYKTYSKALSNLIDFGFLNMIEKSTNQYTANRIALVKNTKALLKHCSSTVEANTKASPKHCRGIVSIDKLLETNKNYNKQEETIYKKFAHLTLYDSEFLKLTDLGYTVDEINDVLEKIENYKGNSKYKKLFLTAKNWLKSDKERGSGRPAQNSKGTASVVSTFSQVKMRA